MDNVKVDFVIMKKQMRSTSSIVLAFMLAGCVEPRVREQYPLQENECEFFNKTDNMQVIWQGVRPDVQWQIPNEYLRYNYGGRSDGAILLRVRITDFAPFVPEAPKSRTEITQNFSTFLLNAYVDMDTMMLNRVGLRREAYRGLDPAPIIKKAKAASYGLYRFDPSDFGRYAFIGVGDGDLYIVHKDNHVTDIIACNADGSVPFPGCAHNFSTEYMDVKLGYRKPHLKDWEKIKKRATDFVDCAYLQTAEKK